MNKISKLINCLDSPQTDKDIIVDIKKARRCTSSHEAEKKIFIKRSVGKDPILNLTPKYSNRTASRVALPLELTLPESRVLSLKHQLGQSGLDRYRTQQKKLFQSTPNHSNKIAQFINYQNLNSRRAIVPSSQQLINTDIKMNHRVPRLFTSRRQMRENEQGTKQVYINQSVNNMIPITLKQDTHKISFNYGQDCFTFNEAMRQTKQMSEVSILKVSDTKDTTYIKYQSSQLNERTDSNLNFENYLSKAFLKLDSLLQSYGYNQGSSVEQDNLRRDKLQMQNSILSMQLKNLQEQYSYLKKERQFKKQKYQAELYRINKRQIQLKNIVMERQKQIDQINQLIIRTKKNSS